MKTSVSCAPKRLVEGSNRLRHRYELYYFEAGKGEPIRNLNTDEVAWLFGTDVLTIEGWVNAGIIKPEVGVEGQRIFRRENVAFLLENLGA